MSMPFAPANPLCLPTRPSKKTIQEVWNTAYEFALNKVGLLLFQQLVGNTLTGDILAQELQDSWDTMLSKNTNGDSKYIQLHTRVDLSPLAKTDILDGEDVVKPLRFNKTTMKEEPVKISVGYIMTRDHIKFRHTMNQMLQDMGIDGLCVLIFPAREHKHIPWTYDIKIVREKQQHRPNNENNTEKNDLIKRIKELEKRYSSAIHRNEHYEAESVLDTLNRFKSQLPGNEPNFIINEEGLVKPWD